ncbi:ArsR/SmtB family transcription factor [Halobacterium yunchengense]|uniref:ArsR/SmtB family transcription factor n=1 Tax=Halobacterium yunchengense TaxID=3108497 RepID=UPI0030097210
MSTHVKPTGTCPRTRTDAPDPSTDELLDLFGDQYTRRVFEAVSDEPCSGREVAETADISRATAYRRLNDLKDAGLVTSQMMVRKDGNHWERYEATVTELSVTVDDGRIEATVGHDD